MEPLVLTFDVGSQSLRALLINKKGQIEAKSQIKYQTPCLPSENPGTAEQDPEFYYENICHAARLLKEQDTSNTLFSRIRAVTITCIRDTVLLLDKDNKPLRNIIVWMDNRRAKSSPSPTPFEKFLLSVVGMTETIDMLYKDAFFNWIRDFEPELYAKASKFIMLPGYINYRLTGTLKDGVANQVGHIPFDNKKRKWMEKGLSRAIAPIPVNMLIDLVESGQEIGKISEETSAKSGIPAGLPLLATGTDKACEALGLGVVSESKAAVSLGSAATIQFCTPHYFEPAPFLPSYPSIIPGYFNGENQIYRGYWTVTWFKQQFCQEEIKQAEKLGIEPEEILNTYLSEVPVGCDGLIMSPHLAPGANNPFAKSTITGLTDHHTKKHLYRAIIEGVNFELIHAMKRMEKRSGQHIKEIYIAGGGSKSDTILRITADMFGLPVKRIQTHEATGIGSSMTAFVGLGEFDSYQSAVHAMVHDGDVFLPNEENHRKYTEIYNKVYSKLEKTNTSLYRAIRSI